MENGAFSDEAFPKFGRQYVLFCHITTKIPGDKHQGLLAEKGGNYFPYLAFLDSDGKVVGKCGVARTVAEFEIKAEKVRRYLEINPRIHCAEETMQCEALLLKMELGIIEYREANDWAAQFKNVAGAQKEQLEMALLELQVLSLSQEAGRDPAKKTAMGEKFRELWREKRVPKELMAFRIYTMTLFDYAASQRDAETFEGVLNAVKEKYGKDPKFEGFIEAKERKLEELKKE